MAVDKCHVSLHVGTELRLPILLLKSDRAFSHQFQFFHFFDSWNLADGKCAWKISKVFFEIFQGLSLRPGHSVRNPHSPIWKRKSHSMASFIPERFQWNPITRILQSLVGNRSGIGPGVGSAGPDRGKVGGEEMVEVLFKGSACILNNGFKARWIRGMCECRNVSFVFQYPGFVSSSPSTHGTSQVGWNSYSTGLFASGSSSSV